MSQAIRKTGPIRNLIPRRRHRERSSLRVKRFSPWFNRRGNSVLPQPRLTPVSSPVALDFQMLAISNLLAIESLQGHGDAFWGVALGLPERDHKQQAFVTIG